VQLAPAVNMTLLLWCCNTCAAAARAFKSSAVTLPPAHQLNPNPLLLQGRNVIIEQSYGPPKITKDGVTVAKAIEFKDRFENLGANLIKQVASATNDVAGDGAQHIVSSVEQEEDYASRGGKAPEVATHDLPSDCATAHEVAKLTLRWHCAGTTTATVLARAIYNESCKSAAAGIAPQEMRKGVQMGVEHVIAELKGRAKMISTTEEIAQVGEHKLSDA